MKPATAQTTVEEPEVIVMFSRGEFDPQTHIRERAYELFVQRGSEPGHDLDDWLQAERELLGVELELRPRRAAA